MGECKVKGENSNRMGCRKISFKEMISMTIRKIRMTWRDRKKMIQIKMMKTRKVFLLQRKTKLFRRHQRP
jgi:hypothetical protein